MSEVTFTLPPKQSLCTVTVVSFLGQILSFSCMFVLITAEAMTRLGNTVAI